MLLEILQRIQNSTRGLTENMHCIGLDEVLWKVSHLYQSKVNEVANVLPLVFVALCFLPVSSVNK